MTWHPRPETREQFEKRNAQIMEWWAMGEEREWIAEQVNLTPARISQIVNSFGVGWTHSGPGRRRGGDALDRRRAADIGAVTTR